MCWKYIYNQNEHADTPEWDELFWALARVHCQPGHQQAHHHKNKHPGLTRTDGVNRDTETTNQCYCVIPQLHYCVAYHVIHLWLALKHLKAGFKHFTILSPW